MIVLIAHFCSACLLNTHAKPDVFSASLGSSEYILLLFLPLIVIQSCYHHGYRSDVDMILFQDREKCYIGKVVSNMSYAAQYPRLRKSLKPHRLLFWLHGMVQICRFGCYQSDSLVFGIYPTAEIFIRMQNSSRGPTYAD